MDTVALNAIYANVTSWWFTLVTLSAVVLFVTFWAKGYFSFRLAWERSTRHRTHRTTDGHFGSLDGDDGGDD